MHQRLLNKGFLRLVIVTSILLLQPNPGLTDESQPSRDDILSKVHESLGRYASAEVSASADVHYLVDGQNSSETSNILIRREGLRALLSNKSCFRDPNSSEPTCRQFDQIVFDNDDVMLWGAGLTPSLSRIEATDELRISLLSKRIAGHQDIDRESLWNGLNDSAAILWIIGYRPLLDYLDEATAVDFRLGESSAEVFASSVHGEAKIELDGTAGWLPTSIQIVKRSNHLIMGRTLSDATEGKADNITFRVNAKDYVNDTEGNWQPSSLTVERKTNWKSKVADITITKINIQSTRFDPVLEESDFESSIRIPVGHPIGVVGAPHLPYIWNGHEAVPGIPDKSYSRPRADQAGSHRGRFRVLIIFNVALVVVLLAVMWKRREIPLK